MAVIVNKWIQKEKKKPKTETASSYESNKEDTWKPIEKAVVIKRDTPYLNATMHKTLRGVRK